jgi:hypothetical protein
MKMGKTGPEFYDIEDYFMSLRQTGFEVDALRESRPNPDLFTDPATYKRRKRVPLMLFFSAVARR